MAAAPGRRDEARAGAGSRGNGPAWVAVVGAGPAGLIAAETIASAGVAVRVFEGMPSPGRKLLMAGRGGLNLTHSEPLVPFLSRYPGLPPELRAALEAFPPAALVAWAEGLGQETFVGSSGRIFPRRMKSSPLLRAWLARLERLGVELALRHRWVGWDADGALAFRTAGGEAVSVRPAATVLALGGASWPRLGADGGWIDALRAAGVEVAPFEPANAAALVEWSDNLRDRFAGAPLKRIALTFQGETVRGEAMITRQGLEGSLVYRLTPVLRAATRGGEPALLTLDLRPDVAVEALSGRLAASRAKTSFSNFVRKAASLPPQAVALLREGGRSPQLMTPDELAALIKALPLRVRGVGDLSRAISSAGGIRFSQVDDALMLKARPGVFVAGEMLDWEAPTGGYLLQASYATGVCAGYGAVRWLAAGKQAGTAG